MDKVVISAIVITLFALIGLMLAIAYASYFALEIIGLHPAFVYIPAALLFGVSAVYIVRAIYNLLPDEDSSA